MPRLVTVRAAAVLAVVVIHVRIYFCLFAAFISVSCYALTFVRSCCVCAPACAAEPPESLKNDPLLSAEFMEDAYRQYTVPMLTGEASKGHGDTDHDMLACM